MMLSLQKRNNMKNWCVITTYKNNFELAGAFVNYYSQYWGITKFYFIIGITNNNKEEIIYFINKLKERLFIDIECFFYETTRISEISELSYYKHKFFRKLRQEIPCNYNKFLNIDNDEFYYHKNIDSIKMTDNLHFHFVEFIPQTLFSTKSNFNWSMQGWFYRVNFFQSGDNYQIKKYIFPDELRMLHRDLDETHHKITHQWCKELYFDRECLDSPWVHKDNGTICNSIKMMNTIKEQHSYLVDNYFCYHIGVPDFAFFKNKKTKWLDPETNKYYMQVGEILTNLEDYYFKFYKHPNENNTFTDNFLKNFWFNTDFRVAFNRQKRIRFWLHQSKFSCSRAPSSQDKMDGRRCHGTARKIGL